MAARVTFTSSSLRSLDALGSERPSHCLTVIRILWRLQQMFEEPRLPGWRRGGGSSDISANTLSIQLAQYSTGPCIAANVLYWRILPLRNITTLAPVNAPTPLPKVELRGNVFHKRKHRCLAASAAALERSVSLMSFDHLGGRGAIQRQSSHSTKLAAVALTAMGSSHRSAAAPEGSVIHWPSRCESPDQIRQGREHQWLCNPLKRAHSAHQEPQYRAGSARKLK